MSAPARVGSIAALGGAVFLLAYLLRNSMGLIEPDIERAYAISATQAGLVSGAVFLGFAASQIPLGIAIDRWGARPVIGVCGLLLALGTLGFTLAQGLAGLIAARLLMGAANSPFFVGLMALIQARVPPERFASYAGLETSIGRAGLLLGAAPLAALIALTGWPWALRIVALLLAIATLALMLVLRHEPRPAASAAQSGAQLRAGLLTALRVPGLAPLVLFQGCASGMMYVLMGAWGAPWLIAVHGFDAGQVAAALSVIALAYCGSALLWGALPRRVSDERGPALAGGAAITLLLALPALTRLPGLTLWIWLGAIGLASGCYPLMLDQLRRALPPPLVVRGITLLGVGSMAVNALLMAASGAVLDLAGPGAAPGAHPPQAFAALFATLAAAMAAATLIYARRGMGRTSRTN